MAVNIGSEQVAVFLDRDGTIIVDKHYLSDPDKVELEHGAIAGLVKMASIGTRLIGITNQSGVARGLFDLTSVHAVNKRIDQLLEPYGISLEKWYICPHAADAGCDCRKPMPGLLLQAVRELGVDPAISFVVGDKLSDVALAAVVGAEGILVETGKGAALAAKAQAQGVAVAADLDHAASLIASRLAQRVGGDV